MKKVIKLIIAVLVVALLIFCGLKLYGKTIVEADGNGSDRESATYENWSGNCIFFADYHTLYAYNVVKDKKAPLTFDIWGISDAVQILGDDVYYMTYDFKGGISKYLSKNLKQPFSSRTEYEDFYEGCVTEEYIYMADCDKVLRMSKQTKETEEIFRGENDEKYFEMLGVVNGTLYIEEAEDEIIYALDTETTKVVEEYDLNGLYAVNVYGHDGDTYFIDYDTGYLYKIGHTLEKQFQVYEPCNNDEDSALYDFCQMHIKDNSLFCIAPCGDIYVSDMNREACEKLINLKDYCKNDEECSYISWCDGYIVLGMMDDDYKYLRFLVFDYEGNFVRERTEKM